MFIRYQHVRNTTIGAAVLGLGALIFGGEDAPDPTPAAPVAAQVAPRTPGKARPQAARPTPAQVAPATPQALRLQVLAMAGTQARGAKAKDALGRSSPWKVNLYDDNGDGRWERLKIDRDRDEKWDESWSFKEGVWRDGDGKAVDAAPATAEAPAAAAAAPASAPPAGPLERAAQMMLQGRATSKKAKDALSGSPVKVNLYDDDGDGRWDRAKVDSDRNDSWDESWTRKGEVLERKLGATGQVEVWTGAGWKAKPAGT